MKIRIETFDIWGEFYVYPSISVTYDYYLNGCYSLNCKFLAWGFSINLYRNAMD